jgi:hypothetical protein
MVTAIALPRLWRVVELLAHLGAAAARITLRARAEARASARRRPLAQEIWFMRARTLLYPVAAALVMLNAGCAINRATANVAPDRSPRQGPTPSSHTTTSGCGTSPCTCSS